MRLQLTKWGNSLAVRLPAACLRDVGLREGDLIEAEVTPQGEIRLIPAPKFDKEVFLARLGKLHAQIPMTEATVETMRTAERY